MYPGLWRRSPTNMRYGPMTAAASPVTNWLHQRIDSLADCTSQRVPAQVSEPVTATEETMANR